MTNFTKYVLKGDIFTTADGHQYAIKGDKGGYDFYGAGDFEPLAGAPPVPAEDSAAWLDWMQNIQLPPQRLQRQLA